MVNMVVWLSLSLTLPTHAVALAGHTPDDYATTYEYDALNRLKRVTKPQVPYGASSGAPTVEESFYDLRGNLVKKKAARDPAGQDIVSTAYTYDAMNRLTDFTQVAGILMLPRGVL